MKNGHIKIQIVVIILYITLVKAQPVYSTIPKIPYTSIVYESILSSSLIYDPNSTIPNSTLSSSNEPNLPYYTKRSSSGLSAGAICAIIIPTIAALLAVAAIAALLKGATASVVAAPFQTSIPYLESSGVKFNAVQDIPIQKPQPVQVVPVQEVQMVPVQQVDMVPVQQVDMVPVQQVDMVPVQQVDMVPVQQVVTEVKEVQVLPTKVLPTINPWENFNFVYRK